MHRVERSVLVPYSAQQMFELVAGVAAYPEFLPWCSAAHVRPHVDGSIYATIDIRYRGARSRFTTRNRHFPHSRIGMELIEGPFRRLSGEWTFRELRVDACRVHLSLHYQFAAGLLGRAIAPVFETIATTMVDSFTQRAEELHGI
ncbi:MAG: type II toxin-antitoxin system RatA family toxin [Gemmatimonadota bacterium]